LLIPSPLRYGQGSSPLVTYSLIAANALAYLLLLAGGDPLYAALAQTGSTFFSGEYWQVFTAMFVHFDFLHIAFNMYALYYFGRLNEVAYTRAEYLAIYLGAGLLGILYYGSLFRSRAASSSLPLLAVFPVSTSVTPATQGPILGKLLLFFLKAGSLTFGSGLVIVPFLEKGLVQQTGWLDERQFLVAVAMGMLSPGPVVITATFVGYVVAGIWGSVISTIGIFLPSFLLVLIVAPILIRYRTNPNVQGFVKGAYAAAIGTILGACVLLGRIAIGDWLTALVALLSLIVLFRWKVSNPLLVAATAIIGLIAFPLLQPAWVFVK